MDRKRHSFNRLDTFGWFDLQLRVAYDELAFWFCYLVMGDLLQ